MDKLTIILLILLSWLQYSLWIGRNGFHDYMHIKKNITTQKDYNSQLKYRNDALFAEINDLNNGQEAIEERARKELGMIKTGEIFYRLVIKTK
ncbi:Cell division protein FtsB [Candidatus Profftia lariciata]|uniref:cell division protein FtsB n=1 Tax=Candidatus Profftia lariciata TaxID=1987921 RepID=UPI001D01328B|nr:cell division protein FtsB [Candidatus Profftia lariciata]UDG81495.1 Cell division protein FtsB [Candidatus Profftia lariciata]